MPRNAEKDPLGFFVTQLNAEIFFKKIGEPMATSKSFKKMSDSAENNPVEASPLSSLVLTKTLKTMVTKDDTRWNHPRLLSSKIRSPREIL